MRTPKVKTGIIAGVGITFFAFADEQVLPKRTHIVPQIQRREVGEHGIADAVVYKINLFPLLDFIAQVAAERVNPEYHVAFFEQPDVTFHRGFVYAQQTRKFVIRHLAPYLQRQRHEQLMQHFGTLHAFIRKQVFI